MQKLTNYFKNTFSIAIFILAISAINAAAAIFTVTNTNDGGAGSLRQVFADAAAASGADTIVFDSSFNTPKTITLASSINNYNSPDPLTITGPGANLLTVKGNDTFRIFTLFFQVTTNANSEVTISGMTISNGRDTFFGGGAIFTQFGKITINNVVITANSGNSGGGIALYNGATLNANNSTISNNTVTNDGGGIYGIQSSSINLTNTTVSGNTAAGSGGGVQADGAIATIDGSTISNNSSTSQSGGGINSTTMLNVTNTAITGNSAFQSGGGISNTGTATITNSSISNNSSSSGGFAGGGGIASSGASLTITGSTINGNTSNRLGAGILVAANSAITTTIFNSTISNNILSTTQGFDGGGGLYLGGNVTTNITNSTISGNAVVTTSSFGNGAGIWNDGTLTLTNATVAGNSAAFNGGGLYRPTSSGNAISIRNSIIANNTAGGTAPDIFGTVNSNGYNLIRNTMGATITGTTTGNITGVDPQIDSVLRNNNNTANGTKTHALRLTSPAINAGDPAISSTDQRSKPRVGTSDIGAYERQADPTLSRFPNLNSTATAEVTFPCFVLQTALGISTVRPADLAACSSVKIMIFTCLPTLTVTEKPMSRFFARQTALGITFVRQTARQPASNSVRTAMFRCPAISTATAKPILTSFARQTVFGIA